jgi:hypothetical protein
MSTRILTRLTASLLVTGVLVAPAQAGAAPTCEIAQECRPTPTAAGSPYAQPLDALGGLNLAQYLADHRAEDPRLRSGR